MSLDGTWNVMIDSDMDAQIVPRSATLVLASEGSTLSGTMAGPYPMGEGVTISDGKLEGDTIAWKAAMRGDRLRPQVLEFSGKLGDSEISGDVEVGIFGTATFKATK